jgi:UDP-2,3-diacylglucosamine hydrolase
VIDCFGEPVMLAHGDAWCLDDLDYQRFRAQIRSTSWQQQFLSRPRAERQAIARAMRSESEQRRELSDIDPAHVAALLSAQGITRLIHGHTHQPGESVLNAPGTDRAARRWVLPDWSAEDRRGGFLRLDRAGFHWVNPPRP